MKTATHQRSSRPVPVGVHALACPAKATLKRELQPSGELVGLRVRVAEAEEALRAIRGGEVDAVVVAGKQGPQVFTLQGAGHEYRVLIESMNEGALILTADGVILYANQSYARMVKHPLEQVLGSSFHRVLSVANQAALRLLLKRRVKPGFHVHVLLHSGDGSQLAARLSTCPLAMQGTQSAAFGLVVTDMTEARRNEERLRALTRRVVEVQEAERARVAFELHERVTQLLCGVLVRSQALANQLSARGEPVRREATKLRELLGQTAEAVERISRNLRPSVLDELGLAAVLRDTGAEFADRTGVSVKLPGVQLTARLPADTELTLYRILQEALKNVEQHARARHVSVRLTQLAGSVRLAIRDDGIGFNPAHPATRRKGMGGLGLLSMRERATYVGGDLNVNSAPGQGTTIRAQIPLRDRQPRSTRSMKPNFD